MSQTAEHGGGKQRSVIAVGHSLPQKPEGAAVGFFGGISQFIQEILDFTRSGQAAQDSTLGFRQMLIEVILNPHLDFPNFIFLIPFPEKG
jgi:hypothetical protein